MTFDEAIKELRVLSMDGTQQVYNDDVIQLINDLREEYAPDIPLEPRQKEFLSDNSEHIVEVVADFDADWEISSPFDDRFFNGLTEEQVVSAWLHPETIKVVDK